MKPGIFTQHKNAGVYHLNHGAPDSLEKIAKAAKRDYRVIDLANCQTKEQALAKIGNDLAFPDWYGKNLDALNDCLHDTDWRPKQGLVINIAGLAGLLKTDAAACSTLIEIIQSACHPDQHDKLPPLWCVIDTPVSGSTPFPAV